MKTVNSISGGKTSAYIAANYPADHNIFSLVRTNDKKCMFPDVKLRQIVSDKIGNEFIGTLEMDDIIYTMLDLEQFIGREITWISPRTFEDVITFKTGNIYLPSPAKRFCTIKMKVEPIAQWCYDNTKLPVEMRIGFRANEMKRAKSMIDKNEKDGLQHFRFKVGQSENGRNKWKELPYRNVTFPLITDGIYKDTIEKYWKDKPVRFAYMNNCVGCFHRNPMLLKHMSNKAPKQFEWFSNKEKDINCHTTWLGINGKGMSFEQIKNHKSQLNLFDDDFNECDSGYCGL